MPFFTPASQVGELTLELVKVEMLNSIETRVADSRLDSTVGRVMLQLLPNFHGTLKELEAYAASTLGPPR